jgi:chromosome partitioning protein
VRCQDGYDLLPGNIDLTAAEIQLMDMAGREQKLKQALDTVRDGYDFVLDRLPAVAVAAHAQRRCAARRRAGADAVRVLRAGRPVRPGRHHQACTPAQPRAQIEGLLRVMFDVRNNLQRGSAELQLKAHFGDKVFRTIIPRNVRLAEAPSHGQSIIGYDRASAAAAWPTSAWPANSCAGSASATQASKEKAA